MFPSLQPIETNPLDSNLARQVVQFYHEHSSKGTKFTRTRWFNVPTVDVYLKYSHRHVQGFYLPSFEVSNVTVHKKRRGIYDALLSLMWATIKPNEILFVENVLDPNQIPLYIKRGFAKYHIFDAGAPSYYRVKQPTD